MPDPFESVLAKDPRFRAEAYVFVHEALATAQQLFGRERHVTGQELCEGARHLSLERYGLMAKAVLNSWGVFATDDFGAIVYNLIDAGLMSKTETDSIDDFDARAVGTAGLLVLAAAPTAAVIGYNRSRPRDSFSSTFAPGSVALTMARDSRGRNIPEVGIRLVTVGW